jgi:hypothetical protein
MKPNPSEYHFVLHTCNLGSKTKTVVNPFTRQELKVPLDDGLVERETEAVRKIFAQHAIEGPFKAGHVSGYSIYANDWVSLRCFELGGSTPVEGIDVFLTLSELTNEALELILELARDGNLALTSQLGKLVRIVGRHPTSEELARWPDAKKLSTTTELRNWLEGQ